MKEIKEDKYSWSNIKTSFHYREKYITVAEPPKLYDPHALVTVQRPLTTMLMLLVTLEDCQVFSENPESSMISKQDHIPESL